MAAMKLKKSKWNLLLDWQKKNCFENCRKKLPDHCIWVWWIMESCSMVTKWKLLNLINTEQYVLIKNTYCVSRLKLQFKMKPFWLLRVDFEETIEKYRSTMWQLFAKITSWLPTWGSSICTTRTTYIGANCPPASKWFLWSILLNYDKTLTTYFNSVPLQQWSVWSILSNCDKICKVPQHSSD